MNERRIPLCNNLPVTEWESLKQQFPVGTKITGSIAAVKAFGIFIDFGADVVGLIDIGATETLPGASKLPYDHAKWPKAGERASGRVIGFRELGQQVALEWLPEISNFPATKPARP